MRAAPALLVLSLCAALGSCVSTKKLADPTILIHSPAGTELGVSTEYGAVFLGRHARGGEVDVTAWFGDGPSLESSVVEPLGGGLYTAETEIRLPGVPLAFDDPNPGEDVKVIGRTGAETWTVVARVLEDERVTGILLRPRDSLTGAPEQIGAGVYVGEEQQDLRLLGLVSGRIRLIDAQGNSVEYVTVIGPRNLWRLVAHDRNLQREPHWVYREDVL